MIRRILLAICLTGCFTVISGAQHTNDISLTRINLPDYGQFSEEYVQGVFRNNGTDSLFSMDIFWQANGGRIYKYHKDNFAIKSGQSWIFTHSYKVKFDKPVNYDIKVWVANPNGQPDENPENDTLYHTVQVIEKYPARKLMIEEITGAWCGYCPRAPIIYEKTIKPFYPQVMMVAIHTGDGMEITESKPLRDTYVTGVPTGFVSRGVASGYGNVDLSPESWKGRLQDMDLEFNPVKLSVYNYYYPDTREWKVDVIADFVLDIVGDYRFNIYVIEDGLSGTGSKWNQRNFFNLGASEPYMELQGAGDPIPGYVHNHVVRKMTGGSWGADGIIPDSVKRGDRYLYSETFTIPENWDPDNLHLIGMVQEYNSRESKRPILNVEEAELSYATGTEPIVSASSIKIYPNPVSDQAILEIINADSNSLTAFLVLSSNGHTILKSDVFKFEGRKVFAINTSNWAKGIYFIKTTIGSRVLVEKIVRN
jgi:hypothetical protein